MASNIVTTASGLNIQPLTTTFNPSEKFVSLENELTRQERIVVGGIAFLYQFYPHFSNIVDKSSRAYIQRHKEELESIGVWLHQPDTSNILQSTKLIGYLFQIAKKCCNVNKKHKTTIEINGTTDIAYVIYHKAQYSDISSKYAELQSRVSDTASDSSTPELSD